MEIFTKIALLFEQGGGWMWAILFAQVASFAIIFERVYALYFQRKITQKQMSSDYENDIRFGDLDAAINKSKETLVEPISRVALAGTTAAYNLGGQPEIQAKMDEVLLEENAQFSKRTGFLAMLGNVGTLLGLLGTIVGMIKSFAAVSYADPMEKATLLSQGISEAMNTTAYGLIMAIPALVMYAVLENRANQLSDDLNQGALRIFHWLSFSYEPVSPKAPIKDRKPRKQAPEARA